MYTCFFSRLIGLYEIMESNISCNLNQLHDDSKFLFAIVLHLVSKICLTFPIFHYKSKNVWCEFLYLESWP
jgi:hypothetical protein